MKRIVALVKPSMRDDVIFALHEIEEFPGGSVSEVQQIGSGPGARPNHADRTPFHAFPTFLRLEIVCPENRVEEIVETIRQKAHTGRPDDGTITVSAIESVVSMEGDRQAKY